MTNLWSQSTDKVYDWVDPITQTVVKFHARLISPAGIQVPDKVPLAVYFHGNGETANHVMSMRVQWLHVAPEPFVLIAPQKQKHGWWFLDSDSYHGWVEGKLKQDLVGAYCRWLQYVASIPGSDADRIGLFGWSAGAYAITELLAAAQDCVPVTGVALAGVHGHGQRDTSDLPLPLQKGATLKFKAYLARLRRHNGVAFLEATHATEDKESKFTNAQDIFQALSERNEELGLEPVSLRELGTAQQDVKPKKNKNKTHHNYFNAAFLRKDLFVALWGGERPPEHEKKDVDDQDWGSDSSPAQASSPQERMAAMGFANSANGTGSELNAGWGASPAADWGASPAGDWGASPAWEASAASSMFGMMMTAMNAMWGGAGAEDDEDTCWDMQSKGFCPRGASCKYCKASAKRPRFN